MQPGFFKLSSKIGLAVVCTFIFFFSLIYLFRVNREKFTDTAEFSGDAWEYQSLAVNLYLGHGYQLGGIEKFSTYKFQESEEFKRQLHYLSDELSIPRYDYYLRGGGYAFYRTPGYPFFLAIIYKLFGIHPLIVKIIQMILLAICASLMPVIGMYYWSRLGILSGLFSSFLFIKYFCPDPSAIMTEPLVTFSLFVLAIFIILWEIKPSTTRTFILGIMTGICLLVKGLNGFLPLLLLIYIAFVDYKKRLRFKLSLVFILGFLLCIVPWNIYASKKNNRFLLLSTQAETLLLDSNNEGNLKTGGWAARWRKETKPSPRYLYNRLKDDYSPVKKLLIFLYQNKKGVPLLLTGKLYKGFAHKEIILFVAGMFLYYLMAAFARRFKRLKPAPDERIPIFPLIFFLNILFITLVFYGDRRFTLPFIAFFILPTAYFPLAMLKFFLKRGKK